MIHNTHNEYKESKGEDLQSHFSTHACSLKISLNNILGILDKFWLIGMNQNCKNLNISQFIKFNILKYFGKWPSINSINVLRLFLILDGLKKMMILFLKERELVISYFDYIEN